MISESEYSCSQTDSSTSSSSKSGEVFSSNPLLSFDDEEEFVRWFPTTFPGAPAYFFRMRPINQRGPRLRSEIAEPPALPPDEFDEGIRHAVAQSGQSARTARSSAFHS